MDLLCPFCGVVMDRDEGVCVDCENCGEGVRGGPPLKTRIIWAWWSLKAPFERWWKKDRCPSCFGRKKCKPDCDGIPF